MHTYKIIEQGQAIDKASKALIMLQTLEVSARYAASGSSTQNFIKTLKITALNISKNGFF